MPITGTGLLIVIAIAMAVAVGKPIAHGVKKGAVKTGHAIIHVATLGKK